MEVWQISGGGGKAYVNSGGDFQFHWRSFFTARCDWSVRTLAFLEEFSIRIFFSSSFYLTTREIPRCVVCCCFPLLDKPFTLQTLRMHIQLTWWHRWRPLLHVNTAAAAAAAAQVSQPNETGAAPIYHYGWLSISGSSLYVLALNDAGQITQMRKSFWNNFVEIPKHARLTIARCQ